jgi:hypothetical protein
MTRNLFIVAIIALVLGFGLAPLWHRSPTPAPKTEASDKAEAWCDTAHRIPYVDAEHCGGMSSCDRAQLVHMARPDSPIAPVPCPRD